MVRCIETKGPERIFLLPCSKYNDSKMWIRHLLLYKSGPRQVNFTKKIEVRSDPLPTIAQHLNPIQTIQSNPVKCPSVSRYVIMVASVFILLIREHKCVAYLPTGVNPPSKRCENRLSKNRDAAADLSHDM